MHPASQARPPARHAHRRLVPLAAALGVALAVPATTISPTAAMAALSPTAATTGAHTATTATAALSRTTTTTAASSAAATTGAHTATTATAALSRTTTTTAASSAAARAEAPSGTARHTADPDTQPPTRPGPITASDVTASSLTLTWAPSTDNVGVVSYRVLIGLGDVVSRKQSRTNSITLTDLAASNTYFFQVTAGDAAGNLSAPSDFLSVTLPSGDDLPPSTPGAPTVANITATRADVTWAPSTDNNRVAAYDILNLAGDAPQVLATAPVKPTAGSPATLTSLAPRTRYDIAVQARDAAGNRSPISGRFAFTTASDESADTTPPTAPDVISATELAPTGLRLSWSRSTDDSAAAITYTAYNMDDGTRYGPTTDKSMVLTGLNPGQTYTFAVVAADATGNVSAWSVQVTVRTPRQAAGCTASFRHLARWPGGYQAEVTVTNTGPALNGWTVGWALTPGQTVVSTWGGGTATVAGGAASVPNAPWNPTLATGASVTIGWYGEQPGEATAAAPAFTLNGQPCPAG